MKQLQDQHSETVSGRGLSGNGKFMIELLTGPSGTWTLMTSDVNGRACIVASGEAWQPVNDLPWLNQGDPS